MHLVMHKWTPSGHIARDHFRGEKKGLSVNSENPVLVLVLADAP